MSAFTVIPWNEFLSYSAKDSKVKTRFPAKADVLIVGNDPQLCNWPVVNFVRSVEDLTDIKLQLFTRPLVLLVECGKHVPIGERLNRRGEILGPSDIEWWLTPNSAPWNNTIFQPGSLAAEGMRPNRFVRVKFAVLVDTSCQSIQRQFNDGFRQVEAFLSSKKSFCLEFDFNAVIFSWWLDQGPQDWLRWKCLDTAYCIGGRIALTNTGEPCHALDFGIWWSLCLPCYFMLAIPYRIWRNVVCEIWDHCLKITGDINAVSSIQNVPQLL